MDTPSAVPRVWIPTLAVAVSSTAAAVAVNVATEWKTNSWAWVAVMLITAVSAAVSVWLYRRTQNHILAEDRPFKVPAPAASATNPSVQIRDNTFHGSAAVNGSGAQINHFY
jgi:membrane protein implicated in regulation of membrane protease activity